MIPTALFILFTYVSSVCVHGLGVGKVKPNVVLPLHIKVNGIVQDTHVTIDSNWRWIHKKDSYDNCFTASWTCPTSDVCSRDCVIEGVSKEDWDAPYGVSVSGNTVTLRYVTKGPYGVNAGSRLYVLDSSKTKYVGFDMRNKELSFTVDVSQLPCGTNGAVYFTEMPLSNSYNPALDSSYGVNYGDAQCPKDIKYLQGKANLGTLGACANEYDIWEANSKATSFALHPCKVTGVTPCATDVDCGVGESRFKGVCDKSGANFNFNREGVKDFYGVGPQFKVDTSKPFRVTTQFWATNTKINRVKQLFTQNNKVIDGGELTQDRIQQLASKYGETDYFTALGGFNTMSDSFARQHALILSIWDDAGVNMRWLDSVYPIGSTNPSDYRGPCSSEDTTPNTLRAKYPQAKVVYSDIEVKDLPSAPPTPPPSPPKPQPTPPKPQPKPPTPPQPVPPTSSRWECTECVFIQN